MKRSRKQKENQLIILALTVFSLLVLVTLFLPLIITSDALIRGFDTILGYKTSYNIGSITTTIKYTNFSILNLIPYLLPLLGLMALFVPFKAKLLKYLLIAILNIGSLVLFTFVIDFFQGAQVENNLLISAFFNSTTFEFGYGAYLAIIACGLNVILSISALVIKK